MHGNNDWARKGRSCAGFAGEVQTKERLEGARYTYSISPECRSQGFGRVCPRTGKLGLR